MCGISQRPADVKKDFITQCDWLVWHRLTWGNDTKVVQRILGSDYADWVEDLNDGEGFLMTDWDEEVRQVQFQRKRTFDAGATPGLDDFERPELKSVSGDLVSDLEEITEEKQARKNQLREMERKLKDKELRIEELEAELAEARDLSNMAEQFARAMMAHATGRAFREDVTGYQAHLEEERWSGEGEPPASVVESRDEERAEAPPDEEARPWPEADGSMSTERVATGPSDSWDAIPSPDGTEDGASDHTQADPAPSAPDTTGDDDTPDGIIVPGDESTDAAEEDDGHDAGSEDAGSSTEESTGDDWDTGWEAGPTEGFVPASDSDPEPAATDDAGESADDWGDEEPYERPVVASLRERIAEMHPVTRGMLAFYRDREVASPLDAHVAAGGDGDRPTAYGRNRELREAGVIAHAGRGRYGYALPSLLDEAHDGRLSDEALAAAVERVEETFRERADAPWPNA
jgi:hypothetical protein